MAAPKTRAHYIVIFVLVATTIAHLTLLLWNRQLQMGLSTPLVSNLGGNTGSASLERVATVNVDRVLVSDVQARIQELMKPVERIVIFECGHFFWSARMFFNLSQEVLCVDSNCDRLGKKAAIEQKHKPRWEYSCMEVTGGKKPETTQDTGTESWDMALSIDSNNLPSHIVCSTQYPSKATLQFQFHPGGGLRQFIHVTKSHVVATSATRNVFNHTFSRIYTENVWGSSGPGSSLEETVEVRQQLGKLLISKGVRSMIDSSCGDMRWMPLVLGEVSGTVPGFRYLGLDVACPVIEDHKRTFIANSTWEFACLDASNQPLQSGYDLIFSRDSLQHLPGSFLHNVKHSGVKYLLVGSYITKGVNKDLPLIDGSWYPIDLTSPPFRVRPEPSYVLDEKHADGKHMLLFDVEEMTWDEDLRF